MTWPLSFAVLSLMYLHFYRHSSSLCAPTGESSDLSAQNALDLLLNMSNARELVGNALQVGGTAAQ